MEPEPAIVLVRAGPDFEGMQDLLDLIIQSFDYMDGKIDPPSSAGRLTLQNLRDKCADEIAIVARQGESLAGCVFLAEKDDHFYLGKLAVHPARQGQGIGGLLVRDAEAIAIAAGKPVIELQTRVELTRNHTTFANLGFYEVARTAHPGFDRPTSITMRKSLR